VWRAWHSPEVIGVARGAVEDKSRHAKGNRWLVVHVRIDGGKMSELKSPSESTNTTEQTVSAQTPPVKKLAWETPKLEDVSEQVMAQPYIRFT